MGRISVFIVVWLTFSGGGLCDGEGNEHGTPAADTLLHAKHAPSFPSRTDTGYSEGDTPPPNNPAIKFSGNIVKQYNAVDDSDSDRADVEQVPVDVGSSSSSSGVSTGVVSTNRKSTDDGEQGTGVSSRRSTSFGPVSSPFFFMCQYPRTGEPSGAGQEDVTLKVQFTGNKTPSNGYDPLAVYEVLVTANVVFDGFLITGVHAFTKQFTQANYLTLPASMHGGATEGLVCSVLHSHISAKPRSSLSFLWMAPPSGTGCVAFLAQGSLRNQILFKDLSVLEVCEKDKSLDQLVKHTSRFAGLNQHGYVFRDDFEDHKLNGDIWSGVEGGSVGREAGKIIHGAALSFSSPDSGAHTYSMDLSAARQLQFALGTGDCSEEVEVQLVYGRASQEDQAQFLPIGKNGYLTHGPVVSAYVADDGSGYPDWDNEARAKPIGDDGGSGEVLYPPLPGEYPSDQPDSASLSTILAGVECESWEPVHTFRAGPSSEVHIQRVPARFRTPGVCVGWRALPNLDNHTCWGLDDVALTTNHASQHPVLDDFDPVDPTNWMFFPGAKVKEWCGSEGNSLVFEGAGDANSRTTTRLLDLSVKPPPGDIIVSHRFFTSPPSGWLTKGAKVADCAGQKQLVFSSAGSRTVCTPYVDARRVGVVTMLAGLSECHTEHSGMVSLRVVAQRGDGTTLLGEELLTRSLQAYTLPVPPQLQLQHTRFCVEQKEAGKKDQDVWVLDHLTLLPWLPAHPQHFFQARVNLECGGGVSEVDVESSSDGGATWTSLHRRCLPGACPGAHSALTSALLPEHIDRWGLVTLPLPYISLTPNTRLRVRQLDDDKGAKPRWWALDNVYIGRCPQGCNGRGLCQPEGRCKCEYGYSGSSCEEPDRDNPVYISEPFSTTLVNNANILKMSGGSSSYRCGVVGAGTAAVFSGRGPRALTTVDINTTNAHFLQFNYVAGTHSDVGKCPGPDEDNESVYVHYSCDGGVTWHLLHTLPAKTYKEPSHISLEVPGGARGPGCRFQVWQERHSGAGRDIWAVDDLTITSHIFNTIQLDFSDGAAANNSLRFHLGEVGGDACGHDSALIFGDIIASGASRFMETKSIGVGPSYMIQFDLVIGCGDTQPQETPNKVVLEYSVNHGITWQLVDRPCTPSTPGCHSHFTRGTVYHASEFPHWKRVTLRLPQHTWSPSTRLRLRQAEESEMMESWAVDNLYIGKQCPGLCSGHGHCTHDGCRCDDNFHGHKCLPLDKLHREIDATFDTGDDVAKYEFQVTGGAQATQEEGCGNVVSGKSLYFGAPGVREWESDDINAQDLEIIQFVLVIGSGIGSTCLPGDQEETLNAGSVVLEYSTDGGISWSLLQELLPSHYRTPALFRGELADEVVKSESGVVRFRLWQPNHQDRNQWAFDNLRISHDTHTSSIQADFSPNSLVASPWLRVTGNHHASYCGSDDAAQVMDGTEPLRQAVTNQLTLLQEDVITFQISVGCGKAAAEGRPVLLQYSKDGGVNWALVVEGCPAAALHCHGPKEPSVYHPGHHGPWTRVLIPVDHRLAQGSVQLRWVQENPSETPAGEFALRGLYIGPPCPYACHGHGLCTGSGICRCDEGYNGTYCGRFPLKNPEWMHDSFDTGEVSGMWERVEGGAVSLGCGPHHSGNALLFSAAGPRFATTTPIDTRYMKYLVFNLQIGSLEGRGRCQLGHVPRDNVVLEYSTDNGQTWSLLQQFEPTQTTSRREAFFIPLPQAARARQTRFRWWQGYNDMMLGDDPTQEERAEWHLDNVMALANETLPRSLYDAFDGNRSEASPWFLMAGASVAPACGRDTNVLHFSGQQAPKYAETWDIRASEATVIQFDIEVGCSGPPSPISVHLQYSTDHGKNWRLVRELCAPPHVECDTFHLPTSYSAAVTPGWTRVTTTLPKTTVGERTRVRVVEEGDGGGKGSRGGSWAIDNIYLGETCPWMCSGHGYCDHHSCRCDDGYFGPYCVPAEVLPCELLDTFRQPDLQSSLWLQAHGSEVSQRCGVLVSDSALVFFKEGLRMATTIDLDMTAGEFLQFTLRLGCDSVSGSRSKRSATILEEVNGVESSVVVGEASRAHGILVQYSTNGGITWSLLKEIHFKMQLEPMFVSISLVDFPMSRSNATRFRVWQPRHGGTMTDTWAIDNVFIGGMPISPNVLYDDFNSLSPMADAWIDWPAGEVGDVCDEYDSYTGLVFKSQEGEHALYTRDLQVDDHSVIQFDLRAGCGEVTGREHNLTLQYSTDYGVTWRTVRPLPALRSSSPDCLHELRTPTVFYPNSDRKWARVIIPLTGLQICGRARFRWWQGYYLARESAAPWGLDNVYIGPSCIHHCAGHGYCINGDQCVCDDNFDGNETCILMNETPQTLNEDFEKGTLNTQFDKWSGAEVSRFCGVVTGEALVFSQQGERMLVTQDLDLTHGSVVQFYIRFGCTVEEAALGDGPVLLQYSRDGGISWALLAELSPDSGAAAAGTRPHTQHLTLPIPGTAKSNTTRLRWWQPSQDGTFTSQWAVDQIHIGSAVLGVPAFTDIDTGVGWLLRPGSVLEQVCGLTHNSLHFASRDGYRFAETPDIHMTDHSFIQFTVSLGCKDSGACFEVELEYSTDQGASWWRLKESCLPSDPDCTEYWPASTLISDLYTGPSQVTLSIPHRVRSALTRVRFIQREGWKQQHSWALSHVYIGDECYHMCAGRGFCDAGQCHCQKGWTGDNCEEPATPLAKYIVADFSSEDWTSDWSKVVGGQLTDHCGPIASGQALHFLGGCSRYLETKNLDLQEALFVQFDLRTGCLDPVSGREAGGDHTVLLQASCDAGISWTTLRKLLLIYHRPQYVWVELPQDLRCMGGRVRWWQPDGGERNRYDWAVDGVVVGGSVTPPDNLTYTHPHHLVPPLWLRRYNTRTDTYCDHPLAMHVMMSTPSEPAILQTTDLQVSRNHSVSFLLALGCGATWDNTAQPVRLEYSLDFGHTWRLVRDMCLPGNSSCADIADASIFYAPLKWNRYVYPLNHIGPAKYVRFRWVQDPSSDVSGRHQWSLRDVYIGKACPHHCLGRGSCIDGVCRCDYGYAGPYCQHVTVENVAFIRDQFSGGVFRPHFVQVQGGLLSEGCGGLEEPPTATFQGPNTRLLLTRPVDTRSGKFVHFTTQIGSGHGSGICRSASHRHHNVFLQYSIDGGIRWHLLRELDHQLYTTPNKEYILIPAHARSPATTFRFWQPRLASPPPAWSLDDLYIGGSEISAAELLDQFEGEPTVSEWLFAPHSRSLVDYCSSGTNGSLVWGADSPGHRAITTQELIIHDTHILQFKVSVGCGDSPGECGETPGVRLEYSRDGGVTGWELVHDSCLPGSSPDPDCLPYTFHPQSIFHSDTHSHWKRITIPLPEKTWGSTTQLRWVQEVRGPGSKVTPWSLDDVYVGYPCPSHCHGRGDCLHATCTCDPGYSGESCEPVPSRITPLPTSLVDGFEGGVLANWALVTGGGVGLGCSSLAPYSHGKHLYFSGCGTRQAVTKELDTRSASKLIFVLRIGSHDHTPSCFVDLSDPQRALDKGVILQYTNDNGITWTTINVHDPLDFRKARRVAYTLPGEARRYGVQLRWWQPDHDGPATDHWALDNVEIVLAQRKDTSRYDQQTFHEPEL
ncbi:reelin [Procambarus clarkii]|uniref:reelin n=1 Tax=Procambarus clarkii TaxID=6728 RepID=UPI0037449280